jgi:hypothetical protein
MSDVVAGRHQFGELSKLRVDGSVDGGWEGAECGTEPPAPVQVDPPHKYSGQRLFPTSATELAQRPNAFRSNALIGLA